MAKKSHAKPLIFISHIGEEKSIAEALKVIIEKEFVALVRVFVSTIPLGSEWFDEIKSAIMDCQLAIVLASPESVKRPWVNFESGAIWSQRKTVIPLCHSGITRNSLPSPLSHLQGIDATDGNGLQQIIVDIARPMDAKPNRVDFSEFVAMVREFEAKVMAQAKEQQMLSNQSIGTEGILEITNVTLKANEPYVRKYDFSDKRDHTIIYLEMHCTVQNMSDVPAGPVALQFNIESKCGWELATASRNDSNDVAQSGFIRSPANRLLPRQCVDITLAVKSYIWEVVDFSSNLEKAEEKVRRLIVELTPVSNRFIGKYFLYQPGSAQPNPIVDDFLEQLRAFGRKQKAK